MASMACPKGLLRPSALSISLGISRCPSRLSALSIRSPFSTSTSMATNPSLKKSNSSGLKKPLKAGKTLRIKKKAFVKTGRPPAPGERKAMRKRIVLSNTNALEVEDMDDMSIESLKMETTVGKVLGLPGTVVDQLRAVEAFKARQGWGLFRRPAMLVRAETVRIANILLRAQTDKSTKSYVIDGERGTGKSVVLLQAMATAFANGWIVFHVPEARDLTTASTAYSPIPETIPTIYSQSTYVANWLGQIAKANNEVLSKLRVTTQHNLPIAIPEDISLARLAELGARDVEVAWPIFEALWTEVTAEGRPPVLMTLDSIAHIMRDSEYRSPEFELIHAQDLALIKHFVDYFSGAKTLPNGGAVIGATTKGNTPASYAMSLAIQQKLERQNGGKNVPVIDPFKKIDMRAYQSMQHAKLIMLEGLTKPEARGLMEYWAASGVLRQTVDERTVSERWAVAGNGVVGEIERSALRMRI